MRASLPILVAAGLVAATTGPRWLRLPDKGSDEPVRGTLAWEDAPLRDDLLDSLREMGWTLRARVRWENMVSATPPSGGERLPAGVVDAGPVAVAFRKPTPIAVPPRPFSARTASVDPYTISLKAIWDSLGIDDAQKALSDAGRLPGDSVTIAFIDGHFQPNHPVLQGANIGDAYDFQGPDTLPWDFAGIYDMHGTQTSGMVASSWNLLPGIAPYARFLFYRVQTDAPDDDTVEEDYLAAAIVRAWEHGADVISISLGFRWVDPGDDTAMYPWSAFDGRTIVGSRVATDAARHGVVVVVAAGNEGANIGAQSIDSPADADSILTVGSVEISNSPSWFSSWGPTFDGRIKPDVVAYGGNDPIAGPASSRTFGAGTSFATPLVAGMAVLALQLELHTDTGEDMVSAIRASGTLHGSPDPRMGWGIPSLRRQVGLGKSIGNPLHLSRRNPGEPWTLKFDGPITEAGARLGLELRDLQGRALFRWEGNWTEQRWTPFPRGVRFGLVVANWWGAYGTGSSTFVVAP